MKLTPIEIRQKQFQKKLRGYDPDEVKLFLEMVSREYESLVGERKALEQRVATLERETAKLRDVEDSLVKTLKTAQETSAQIENQATQSAELRVREALIKADNLEKDARWQARQIIADAEAEAKRIYSELSKQVKSLEINYNELEKHKDELVVKLNELGHEVIDKVRRLSTSQRPSFVTPDYIPRSEKPQNTPEPPTSSNVTASQPPTSNTESESFFDRLS